MIPSKDERCKRACYIDSGVNYGHEKYSCIFLDPDWDMGSFPCVNDNSLYYSMEDRRGRPCDYHVTIDEVNDVLETLGGIKNGRR